eukprot:3846770-Pleurochrysis_carterae.AAC.1
MKFNKYTLVMDGWDDVEKNHLVNVQIGSAKALFFQGTKKLTSTNLENAQGVADMIITGMRSTGALNVVQVCTDTCSVMKAGWQIVEAQYPWVTSTCCGPHMLSLELKDFAAKIPSVKNVMHTLCPPTTPSPLALAVAATTFARLISVVCGQGILLVTTTRPAAPRALNCTVRTESESPLDHGATMRYESTQQNHEGNAQRRINANARTCKCE